MIAIIDYDAGNIKSVEKAIQFLGEEVVITRNPDEILNASRVILPGVGAFGDAMEKLHNYGLVPVIQEVVKRKIPFLGICLGQQVLMSSSDESPGVKGLDLFKGHAEILSGDVKIPHMGWNQLKVCNDSPILDGIDKEFFYFVHSYHVVPDDEEIIAGVCDYGGSVVASLSQNNLFSTQFHPEKSGEAGLKILKNFTELEI